MNPNARDVLGGLQAHVRPASSPVRGAVDTVPAETLPLVQASPVPANMTAGSDVDTAIAPTAADVK